MAIAKARLEHYQRSPFACDENARAIGALERAMRELDSRTKRRMAEGIDGLQHRGSTVVFGELDWSPGIHEQCVGRVQREGQTRPVFAYYVVSQVGSDPVVADMLGLKQAQADGVLGVTDLERAMGKKRDDGGRVQSLARAYLEQNRVAAPVRPAEGVAHA